MSETITSTPRRSRWYVWQRLLRGPWKRVASGMTEAEARANFERVPFRGRFRDVAFLIEGRRPDDPPPSRPAA